MNSIKMVRPSLHLSNKSRTEAFSSVIEAMKAEFEVAMGSTERVRSACNALRKLLEASLDDAGIKHLLQLPPLLSKRVGEIVVPLFELIDEISRSAPEPWPFLEGMLGVKEKKLFYRALDRTLQLVENGSLSVDLCMAEFFAVQVEEGKTPFRDTKCLSIVAKIINRLALTTLSGFFSPLEALYLNEKDFKLRALAARLLDLDTTPVSRELAELVIGQDAYQFLASYLNYTRATHLDLLHLLPFGEELPLCLVPLQNAEALCGKQLLQEVVSRLGWAHLNLGLEVRKIVGVRIGTCFPLMVSPQEASLFDTIKGARRSGECCLFIAHGGIGTDGGMADRGQDLIARFRKYNLAHANVLSDILEVSPLTCERIRRIVERMDKIVSEFVALFSTHTEECDILPHVYQEIRERIVSELEKNDRNSHFSPELVRLVQAFENPESLGEVRTLHGLKRYLHQKGLRLGFRLKEAGRAADRTISLVVASRKEIFHMVRCIHYADLEQGTEEGLTRIPYPVAIVGDSYARQILHGQKSFPETRIFCYGNEVHYYMSFKNHPALIRIDFSPPLQGGMIDIEYYGVSKYEIDSHPNPALNAIREFFIQLEYHVTVKDTRVHARYDKERTVDLGLLCKKAEALFRLVPYFMEIDWIIGSLNLPVHSRKAVAAAWSRFFVLWGVLPLDQLLTRDRQGILLKVEPGHGRVREIAWSGQGPYLDQFSAPFPPDLCARLWEFLSEMGIETSHLPDGYGSRDSGQIPMEDLVLKPLQRAVAARQIIETSAGFRPSPPELFRLEHEAEKFAKILDSEDETILASAVLARIVAPLEQILDFRTTGSLNGHDVGYAPLPLCGATLGIYVLRDSGGIIHLALFTRGQALCLRREAMSMPWQSNGSLDAFELAALLRRNSYPSPDPASLSIEDFHRPETIRSLFFRENPRQGPEPFPGEKVLQGQKASPGRAMGPVIFRMEGRAPEDFEGKLLVALSVRPEDYPFLYRAAGIIATGGAILSHAGLTAVQLRKPALIIRGQWQRAPDGAISLLYRTLTYREIVKDIPGFHMKLRFDMHEQEHLLREGDLAILDSQDGTLRILGQDRDVLSFQEGFRHFREVSQGLNETIDEKKILILRGRRLRARHQIEKLMARLTDPVLARHAVHELLLSEYVSSAGGSRGEKVLLLSVLLNNPSVAEASGGYLKNICQDLRLRHQRLAQESLYLIRSSNDLYEILALRLQVLRLRQTVEGIIACLRDCGFDTVFPDRGRSIDIDGPVRERLEDLRSALIQDARTPAGPEPDDFRVRHPVRQIEQLDLVIETSPDLQIPIRRMQDRISCRQKAVRDLFEARRILSSEDGGFELFPFIGWKGANLAETERLLGTGRVPPWFAVTDHAFREVMDAPLHEKPGRLHLTDTAPSLRKVIRIILSRSDLDNLQKSWMVRQLWEDTRLPQTLADEILTAYRRMNKGPPDPDGLHEDVSGPLVAIRSSALEEDTETSAQAGEFDTFLFIRGEKPVIDYLKMAWSGLWTERAIHYRNVLHMEQEEPGGGVIIQQIARSRVSGVLQTVNIAEDNFREMVINAGWGMGQGIVSGTVSADHIVVAKEGINENSPIRFHYITNDKQSQVVFDEHTGLGTVRTRTLYHQGLRPALEYIELYELALTAARLEKAYGYPLNIEYCFEGTKLWILQVRPIAASAAILQETLRHYPLGGKRA